MTDPKPYTDDDLEQIVTLFAMGCHNGKSSWSEATLLDTARTYFTAKGWVFEPNQLGTWSFYSDILRIYNREFDYRGSMEQRIILADAAYTYDEKYRQKVRNRR